MSWEDFNREYAKTVPLSQKQIDDAKSVQEALVELGNTWGSFEGQISRPNCSEDQGRSRQLIRTDSGDWQAK